MIQESGNIEIFESEPDIFQIKDFNTKELLISSIVSELKRNDVEKCVCLWRKIVVLTKSELKFLNGNQQQINNIWINCFKRIYEKCKNQKAFIQLLQIVHEENKDIFEKFVESKAFFLLKSLNCIQCDINILNYVRFEQLFKNVDNSCLSLNSKILQNDRLIKLRNSSDEIKVIMLNSEQSEIPENERNSSLKQINKNEIIQHLEEYNVFVLAHVFGYFMPGTDSLIYYLFAKKLLRIKNDEKNAAAAVVNDYDEECNQSSDSDDEMYNLNYNNQNKDQKEKQHLNKKREIFEIIIDKISSVEFIICQIQKILKKRTTNSQVLKKYLLLHHQLCEKEQNIIDTFQKYSKYNSSSYRIQWNTNRKLFSEGLYLRITKNVQSLKEGDCISDKTSIWKYFDTLLAQESADLLDCSQCKTLMGEFIESKFLQIINVYESASVEFKIEFSDILNKHVENKISLYCSQAPLRKQLYHLLERIQLNMENVDEIIFNVIIQLIIQQNSNDSINIVLISIKDALSFNFNQNQIISSLSTVMRMSFLLQDLNKINQLKQGLSQNINNMNCIVENFIRDLIANITTFSSITDIIKINYLTNEFKDASLQKNFISNCSDKLSPNALIPLLTRHYISFENIALNSRNNDNILNYLIIKVYQQFGQKAERQDLNDIILAIEKSFAQINSQLLIGFILQYIGAGAFNEINSIYKLLLDTLLNIINGRQEIEQKIKEDTNQSKVKTEMEFLNYLEEQKQYFGLCPSKSLDDLIVYNIIDLYREKKYYDAAKLNYKYQRYSGNSGVSDYLNKLKQDIVEMQSNPNLSNITLKLLEQTKFKIQQKIK